MTPTSSDPTERFSNRVADYERFRPGYPPALIAWLRQHAALPPGAVVADVGAGTGLSSALFLDAGCEVYAVEPNAPMRAAAERRLGGQPRFHAVAGRAEATTLGDASVDLVGAGTAFHWFEPSTTRGEFARILRPHGQVALFWNERRRDDACMRDYEALLVAHCPGYAAALVLRRSDPARANAFLGGAATAAASFDNAQTLDFDSLLGRVLSSSYAPKPGHAAFPSLKSSLRALFDAHAVDAHVSLHYLTRLHLGRIH